jgi:hypothetical protein
VSASALPVVCAPTAAAASRRRARLLGAVLLAGCAAFAFGAAPAFVALGRLQNLALHGRASDPVCSFRQRTGMPCLGCGGTRALRLASRGDLRGALRANPLGAWAAVVVWLTALGAAATVLTGESTWLRRAAWITAVTVVPAVVGTFVWWWRALPSGPLGP